MLCISQQCLTGIGQVDIIQYFTSISSSYFQMSAIFHRWGSCRDFKQLLEAFFFLSYVHTGTATLNFSLQYQIKIHVKLIGLEIAAHL